MDSTELYGLLLLAKELRGHPHMANSLELVNRQLRAMEEQATLSVAPPPPPPPPKPVNEQESKDIPQLTDEQKAELKAKQEAEAKKEHEAALHQTAKDPQLSRYPSTERRA